MDWTKQIKLRDGTKARAMGELRGVNRSMVVAYEYSGGEEGLRLYPPSGKYSSSGPPHEYDVVEVAE
jgi:hypothetical protein